MDDTNFSNLYNKALFYLSFRQRTVCEMEKYLLKKSKQISCDEDVVNQIIKRLKELNYLNDLEFAKSYIILKDKTKPRGKKLLYFDLLKKGLKEETIEKALAEIDEDEEVEKAKKVLRKKSQSLKSKNDFDKRNKLQKFLYGRGFSYEIAKKAILEN